MTNYVEKVTEKVKEVLSKSPRQSMAHGIEHFERVRRQSVLLANWIEKEDKSIKVDLEILQISALLHDIDWPYDQKENHVERSEKKAKEILEEIGYSKQKTKRVARVISEHSSEVVKKASSWEAEILFDADKMDALGVIGIARVFTLCGQRGWGPTQAIQWYKGKIKKTFPLLQTSQGKEMANELKKDTISFIKKYEQENKFLLGLRSEAVE